MPWCSTTALIRDAAIRVSIKRSFPSVRFRQALSRVDLAPFHPQIFYLPTLEAPSRSGPRLKASVCGGTTTSMRSTPYQKRVAGCFWLMGLEFFYSLNAGKVDQSGSYLPFK